MCGVRSVSNPDRANTNVTILINIHNKSVQSVRRPVAIFIKIVKEINCNFEK